MHTVWRVPVDLPAPRPPTHTEHSLPHCHIPAAGVHLLQCTVNLRHKSWSPNVRGVKWGSFPPCCCMFCGFWLLCFEHFASFHPVRMGALVPNLSRSWWRLSQIMDVKPTYLPGWCEKDSIMELMLIFVWPSPVWAWLLSSPKSFPYSLDLSPEPQVWA